MGIEDYNGGSALAMIGKDCVCVASDKRLGENGYKTVEMNFEKCYQLTPHAFLVCCGLATDVETLYRTMRFHKNLFHLREEREMKPQTLGTFLANQLYQRRFSPWFVSPMIAGIEMVPKVKGFADKSAGGNFDSDPILPPAKEGDTQEPKVGPEHAAKEGEPVVECEARPFAQSFDFIGAPENVRDFGAVGTAAHHIIGACEAYWRPDMGPEELFTCASQCLMAGLDRDCFSGWGAVVHIITKDEVITRHIETRMD